MVHETRSVIAALGLAASALFVALPAWAMPGAIFSTDASCGSQDLNVYQSKEDVYLHANEQGGSLPNGQYYLQVTEPEGALLGASASALVTVSNGALSPTCVHVWDITHFADTTNPAGEYKVWLSKDPTFPSNESKTDNFKVDPVVPQATTGTLVVQKFYDANANGVRDGAEPLIVGWKVNISVCMNTIDRFTSVSAVMAPATCTVSEYSSLTGTWYRTTAGNVDVVVPAGNTGTALFGNVCVGAGGGLTLGFWSNKNGQALVSSDDLLVLGRSLNLRNADGSNFDPISYAAFRTWILGATATNMAYMLSAQLAAMELNVYHSKVTGSALFYAPGTLSANALGFATVQDVMAEANAELGLHGLAVSAGATRTYQEALKNALDKANNNLTFVQSAPCAFSFSQ